MTQRLAPSEEAAVFSFTVTDDETGSVPVNADDAGRQFFTVGGILQHDQTVVAAGDLLHGFQKIIGVLLRHLPDDNG